LFAASRAGKKTMQHEVGDVMTDLIIRSLHRGCRAPQHSNQQLSDFDPVDGPDFAPPHTFIDRIRKIRANSGPPFAKGSSVRSIRAGRLLAEEA
jgi:hypothetical protein